METLSGTQAPEAVPVAKTTVSPGQLEAAAHPHPAATHRSTGTQQFDPVHFDIADDNEGSTTESEEERFMRLRATVKEIASLSCQMQRDYAMAGDSRSELLCSVQPLKT